MFYTKYMYIVASTEYRGIIVKNCSSIVPLWLLDIDIYILSLIIIKAYCVLILARYAVHTNMPIYSNTV